MVSEQESSSHRVEPVDILSEPDPMTGVIGWSQWIRSYGVEPVDMVSEPVDMVVL